MTSNRRQPKRRNNSCISLSLASPNSSGYHYWNSPLFAFMAALRQCNTTQPTSFAELPVLPRECAQTVVDDAIGLLFQAPSCIVDTVCLQTFTRCTSFRSDKPSVSNFETTLIFNPRRRVLLLLSLSSTSPALPRLFWRE